MNVVDLLRGQTSERPNAAAIIDRHWRRDRITTFAQLDRFSAQAAGLLWKHGLRPGDGVLIFHPMSAELYVALMAVFRLGAIATFVDPSAGRAHLDRCCELARPKALLLSPKACLLCLLSSRLRRIPLRFVTGLPIPGARYWQQYKRLPPRWEVLNCPPRSAALLTFTSGSTGMPKAVARSHELLLAQHRALAESLELQAGDVDLATMPIVLLANLASGVTSVIPNADVRHPGSIRPGPVIDQIERHCVVSSVASPAFFERLVAGCDKRQKTLPTLRKLFTGGAPVFPRTLKAMQEMAPSAEVVAIYGSTEAEPIAHVSTRAIQEADHQAMLEGKGLLVGKPVASIELRILRDRFGQSLASLSEAELDAHTMATGEAGEIVVLGPHVLTGYLFGRGDKETKIRVGDAVWHRTGDAGYLDGKSRLWLLGRCSARIRDEKGEIYPFAVETAIHQFPKVRRAALIALQGRRALAVEFSSPPEDNELRTLKGALEAMHVRDVHCCAKIPVDSRHNAKIDYPALEKLLARRQSRNEV